MESLWKEEYRIGIEKIDQQHQMLFGKIEEMLNIARSSEWKVNRKGVMDILDFLIEYTDFHFETEEGFQQDRAYKSYPEHKKIHVQFKESVLAYQKMLATQYSAKTLKSFIGMLITWLVNHVCVCDRKIVKNIPIQEVESFSDTESYIKNVANRLFTKMYDIPIRDMRNYIYMGHVEGEVIVRTVVKGKNDHMMIYGMSAGLANLLYRKMSGMNLSDIKTMDDVEKSAFVEIGNIFSSYIMGGIEAKGNTAIQFDGDLHIGEYYEKEYNANNSVVLEIMTEYGKADILYSLIKQNKES